MFLFDERFYYTMNRYTMNRYMISNEWPQDMAAKLDLKQVREALDDYIHADAADKAVIEAHDAYDDAPSPDTMEIHWAKISQLRRACTISRRLRKRTWRILMDVLEEDYEYTSTDEEDESDTE